jgi:pimeloyl-ACP methyl ester carboxylesterase
VIRGLAPPPPGRADGVAPRPGRHRSGSDTDPAHNHRVQTQWIRVAEGVELAADTWAPSDGAAAGDSAATGDAAPFVLVHGLASNARLWDGVAARSAERGHTAVTVDLRGHGRSSKPDGPYDVPTVADDLAALIGALGLDRPVVAGQSWGGNVVLELAARHPSLVRGIACVDGGWLEPRAAFPSWEACREALAPPRLAGLHRDDIERYIRGAHPDWSEAGIEGTLANFETRPDGTVAPWLTYDRHIDVLRGMWEHHPSQLYPEMRVPVLLVPVAGGDAEREALRRQGVELALATLPDARVRWFAGDHDVHAQHPTELADVLIEMVDGGFFA